jgi:hypothetical protein
VVNDESRVTKSDDFRDANPVGRVNLPRDGSSQPSLGWNRRNILLGIGAVIVMLLSLYIILQGVFQATPTL